MGGAAAGAMDANAFNAAMRSAHDGVFLPDVSTLTYQGVFNEHSYHTGGPEDTHQVAISAFAARGRDPEEVWVACFLKSCRDGQPRDHIPMDLIVVLDVSGSMNWSVDGARSSEGASRLALAKEALMALILKLRPDDGFGLATFTNQGQVIQPLVPVNELRNEELHHQIHELRAGGGTTISAGLEAAVQISGDGMRSPGRHRRLLFLTDMDDMRPGQLDDMVATQSERGLYLSFIGIGMNFKAELAEQVSKHQGSNYFCITQEQELRKTIVDNFDWNFFPAAFNVEMTEQSDSLQLCSVYGTPYDTRDELVEAEWMPDAHRFYPGAFKSTVATFLLCVQRTLGPNGLPMPALQSIFSFLSSGVRSVIRVDTVFPSAVQSDGAVDGGLILLKLLGAGGQVRLTLRYEAGGHSETSCQDVLVPAEESSPLATLAIQKGVTLQRYVETCRTYLMLREPIPKDSPGFEDYANQLRLALSQLLALEEELNQNADHVDSLCPGVRDQLASFARMAEKHSKSVVECKDAGYSPAI